MRNYSSLCALLYPFLGACPAFAGAWTQPEGRMQAIFNHWYYHADERFSNSGQNSNQLTYQKFDINPYFEYGLTDSITLGTNLSLQRVHQKVADGSWANWGVGDSEFFARFKLWQQDGWAISAEPLVKLPSPGSLLDQPPIGSDNADAAMKLAGGYGFDAFGYSHYISGDVQYRYRFGDPENQLRFEFTAGMHVAPQWELMPQLLIVQRTKDPAVAAFTQTSADDYNLTKLQISAVYHYRDDVAFQLGAFSHIDGKNVSGGEGALFAVWTEF
ncbi:MAG: hypothetical protein AB7L92_01550 [Alphaproteobacteria bacterium]